MEYIVSECFDGHYEIQRPNGFGGLYPLTMYLEPKVRSVPRVLELVTEDVREMDPTQIFEEGIQVVFRYQSDPANNFTH